MSRSRRIPKPAFETLHQEAIDQVSQLLRDDWERWEQLPEVAGRMEEFRANRKRFFDLRVDSLVELAWQWDNGVKGVHDDCSTVTDEEEQRWQHGSYFDRWRKPEQVEVEPYVNQEGNLVTVEHRKVLQPPLPKIRGRYITNWERCGTITCRPGDPFGCAMGKRRMHMERIAMMLEAWADHGTFAVGRFEVQGFPNQPLTEVLQTEQDVFTGMVGTETWSSDKKRGGVQGHVCTITVTREPSDRRWVVRRWMILAVTQDRHLEAEWDSRMLDRWERRLDREGAYPRWIDPFIDIEKDQLAGLAQLVTSAVSELDPPKPGYKSIKREFPVPKSEQKDVDLHWDHDETWEELVRALDGDKMLLASRARTDHPAWAASRKASAAKYSSPDWRLPARPMLTGEGLPATPTKYEVISRGAATRRKLGPDDRVFVLEAGQSWDDASRERWQARQDERRARYRRAAGLDTGGKA